MSLDRLEERIVQTAVTTLAVSAAMGTYGGTTTLSAQLLSSGSPVAGETIDFHIGSTDVGAAVTDINGIAIINGASLVPIHAGTYTNDVTARSFGDANFSASYGANDLVISTAPLTITANNQAKAYGAALPTLTASYAGFVNGDTSASLTTAPTITTSANAASHVAGSPYAITAAGAADSDYAISYVGGSLAVTAAPLTITANNQAKAYGAALPTLTASYTGLVNGDTSASLTTAPTISTAATSSSHVAGSPYAINAAGAADSDYAISYVGGNLAVTAAPLTITANNQAKAYGAALPTLTASYTGLVNGDTSASLTSLPTITTSANAASRVAGSPYAITASGAVDGDYAISSVDGNLTVTQAPLTVVADNQSKVYGAALPTLTASYTGLVNGDTSASLTSLPTITTSAGAFSDVNSYTVTAAGAVDGDYSIGYSPGTLSVTPAQLSIAAAGQTSTYGQNLTTLTGTISGLLNGDDVTAHYATMATASSDVVAGGYPIVVTGISGSKAANYAIISQTPAVATVTPAPLQVVGNITSKVYGQANPNFGVSYSGFVLGQGPNVLTGNLGFSTAANQVSHVNSYFVTPGGLSSSNYAIQYVNGGLAVTPAPLAIASPSPNRIYGQAVPTLSPLYAGFVNSDTPANLSYPGYVLSSVGPATHVGFYSTSAQGAGSFDYAISYLGGTATVYPATLTITPNGQFKGFGQPLQPFTANYSGFVNGESTANLTTQAILSTSATAASAPGFYPILSQGATSPDYLIVNNFNFVDVLTPVAPPLNPGQVAFVNSLYSDLLGHTSDPQANAYWINLLNQGTTRASIAQRIYGSAEATSYRAHHYGPSIGQTQALANAQKAQANVG